MKTDFQMKAEFYFEIGKLTGMLDNDALKLLLTEDAIALAPLLEALELAVKEVYIAISG